MVQPALSPLQCEGYCVFSGLFMVIIIILQDSSILYITCEASGLYL